MKPVSHARFRPVGPTTGFVVAMRAKFVPTMGPVRREWIIVSRWGANGDHLSISRTFVQADRDKKPPLQLTPCWTMLGRLKLPSDGVRPVFLFSAVRPAPVALTGVFTPAEGFVRLSGRRDAPRLHAEGRYLEQCGRSRWRLDASRVPWFGEFVEPPVR